MTENTHTFSDDDIVISVCGGRTQNFELLVHRYKKKLINFIYKMIFDYDEAQSLTQDVFIKVYETIKKYKRQDNFQAFIFTIAKNITLNYIKKQKRMSWLSTLTSDSNGSMEGKYFRAEETQQANIELSQKEALIDDGLKTLNENQRIALIMKIYLEFSYKKIAEITGWSEPKIETLISRAKSNLKAHVRAHEINSSGVAMSRSGHSSGVLRQKVQESKRSNVLEMRSL